MQKKRTIGGIVCLVIGAILLLAGVYLVYMVYRDTRIATASSLVFGAALFEFVLGLCVFALPCFLGSAGMIILGINRLRGTKKKEKENKDA